MKQTTNKRENLVNKVDRFYDMYFGDFCNSPVPIFREIIFKKDNLVKKGKVPNDIIKILDQSCKSQFNPEKLEYSAVRKEMREYRPRSMLRHLAYLGCGSFGASVAALCGVDLIGDGHKPILSGIAVSVLGLYLGFKGIYVDLHPKGKTGSLGEYLRFHEAAERRDNILQINR